MKEWFLVIDFLDLWLKLFDLNLEFQSLCSDSGKFFSFEKEKKFLWSISLWWWFSS